MHSPDSLVFLDVAPDLDGGELMRRGDVPTDAYATGLLVDGAECGGEAGVSYEVWLIDR